MTKSYNFIFVKGTLFFLVLVLFASCDKEFNTIGVDIVGNDDFLFETVPYDVTLTNTNYGTVQTNDLLANALGIYINPLGETTTGNFVTQLALLNENPTVNLALHQEIVSVVLTVPYFSTKTGFKEDGVTGIYELDSIYGSKTGKLKLSIYESGSYMRDIDPAIKGDQIYYSNENSVYDNAKKALLNTDAAVSQNTEFFFSDAEYNDSTTDKEGVVTTKRTAPEMRINLDKDFFKSKIFSSTGVSQMASNNLFKNYFRGLYFKVENSGSNETNQMLINFKQGKITITYKEDASATDQSEANRVQKTIVLNFSGNSSNLLSNSNSANFSPENLYLKGGEGSMVFINLFNPLDANGNGVSDELDELRKSKILINDASLTVYLNQNAMGSGALPKRLYLYNVDQNKQLLDYDYDASVGTITKNDKKIFGGILNTSDNSYKIKLTHHLRNLVMNDTVTNVKLGLVITENINDVSSKDLKTPLTIGTTKVSKVPESAVINPLNAVLYSNTNEVPLDKKIKFQIYYTKPN